MENSKALEIIYRVSRSKMSEGEAALYVGEVVTFCINRLTEHNQLSTQNLSMALADEAQFHLDCDRDAA